MRFIILTLLCLIRLADSHYVPRYSDRDLYNSTFTSKHLESMKNATRDLFHHGFSSYMSHGFPFDEVMPLSCQPRKTDFGNHLNSVTNDALGNYSLTLIDNLDTLAVMGEYAFFKDYCLLVKQTIPDFDIDTNVQVFETTIRALGGLLSAHLFASDSRFPETNIPQYDGFLLRLAHDLGKRLLLAFNTQTGIPLPRTNLRYGPLAVPKVLQGETCTAGAASPILEFTLLSKLTRDDSFALQSRFAFFKLWRSRSQIDLLPMTVEPSQGKWLDTITGVGASIDSFYEYALKAWILFGDDELYEVFFKAYNALAVHSKGDWLHSVIDVNTGLQYTTWIDSLSAFWPGLQVLAGDLANAVKSHLSFLKLWNHYGGIPERWNYAFLKDGEQDLVKWHKTHPIPNKTLNETHQMFLEQSISLEWYPLRPEFIESTYHLFTATKDPLYLQIGQQILHDFSTKFLAPCGFAGYSDITRNIRQDQMESFVLGESLKYLYLLFDEGSSVVHRGASQRNNMIFSTEGHPLWLNEKSEKPEVEYRRDDVLVHYSLDLGVISRLQSTASDILKSILAKKGFFGKDSERHHIRFRDLMRIESNSDLFDIMLLSLTDDTMSIEFDAALMEENKPFASRLEAVFQKVEAQLGTPLARPWVQDVPTVTAQPPVVDNPYLIASRDLFEIRTTCQVWHLNNSSTWGSQVLARADFYDFDRHYNLHLWRPLYLPKQAPFEMELQPLFYNKFTTKSPICKGEPSTETFEALFDPREGIKLSDIALLSINTSCISTREFWTYAHNNRDTLLSLPGDLWVPALGGLRLKFEKIGSLEIDEFGNRVSEKFIKSRTDSGAVLRILRVNGRDIGPDNILWVNHEDPLFISGMLSINQDGLVVLNGDPIDNMRSW